jgi:hypothetical protein
MTYTNRIAWETLRSIDSATFTGVNQNLGTPLLYPSYICKLVNNSTSLVIISVDGINDVDVAPSNSFFLYDEGLPALPAGTQIMIRGSAGVGLVYLVSQYIINS